jgi:hypothetical protein
MTVVADIRLMFLRELATFRREVELFPDDATLWRTVPGVTNSAGNLALHIAGTAPLRGRGARKAATSDRDAGTREGSRHGVGRRCRRSEWRLRSPRWMMRWALPFRRRQGRGDNAGSYTISHGFHLGQAGLAGS